jgi:hypothetical protein
MSMRGAKITRVLDTILVSLPIEQWQVAMDGVCRCDVCKADKGTTIAFWDTLAVSRTPQVDHKPDTAWMVHDPSRYTQAERQQATAATKKVTA